MSARPAQVAEALREAFTHAGISAELRVEFDPRTKDYSWVGSPAADDLVVTVRPRVPATASMADLHSALAGQLVADLVWPVIERDGGYGDVFALLESVTLGVLLANAEVFRLEDRPQSALAAECARAATERFMKTRALQRAEPRGRS